MTVETYEDLLEVIDDVVNYLKITNRNDLAQRLLDVIPYVTLLKTDLNKAIIMLNNAVELVDSVKEICLELDSDEFINRVVAGIDDVRSK